MSNIIQSRGAFTDAASGRWAGEQLLRAMQSGKPLSPSVLRTLDTLRKDEWKSYDDALVEEAAIRLRGVADLIEAGLTKPIANALGKTIHEYEKVTDMQPAITSLDGLARGDNDRQTFSLASVPLPITHKDFNISIRTLAASRERGEALDTTQVRTAGRLVSEALEAMLFDGGPTFGGVAIYGYRNHPNRNTGTFAAGSWAASARTGTEIITDLLTAKAGLEADRMYGPYWLYIAPNMSTKFEEDFKTNSDKTIRTRVLEVDGIEKVGVSDKLADDEIVLVQATSDVVEWLDGEPLQTVQWDIYGGMAVAFKAMAIQVPLIKADAQGRSGVYHMTVA